MGLLEDCPYYDGCTYCQSGQIPCVQHRCKRCEGKGLVCPACRGDRIVQLGTWHTSRPKVLFARCEICCEGNQVNSDKEQRAIERWLKKHSPQQPDLKVVP